MKSFVSWSLALLPLLSSANGRNLASRAQVEQPGAERTIEGDYRVLFHDGHTLDGHFSRIGQNLSEQETSNFHWIEAINGYRALLDPDTMDHILNDPGVEVVEQNERLADRKPLPYRREPFAMPREEPKVAKRWTETIESGVRWWLQMTNDGRKSTYDEQTQYSGVSRPSPPH
jgi:hypothetical protein